MTEPILSVRDFKVEFPSHGQAVAAVRGIGFDIMPGEILALVGESGSGKSVTALSILDLLPPVPRPAPPAISATGTRNWSARRKRSCESCAATASA